MTSPVSPPTAPLSPPQGWRAHHKDHVVTGRHPCRGRKVQRTENPHVKDADIRTMARPAISPGQSRDHKRGGKCLFFLAISVFLFFNFSMFQLSSRDIDKVWSCDLRHAGCPTSSATRACANVCRLCMYDFLGGSQKKNILKKIEEFSRKCAKIVFDGKYR